MRATGRAMRGGLALLTAGALAFGAVQAAAAPAEATDGRVCNGRLCDRVCQTVGSIGGVCNEDGFCVCFL
jgi:hypothetical protein